MILQYVKPSGAYFIFINTQKIRVPASFRFPPGVADKRWDWKLCWFLIQEIGVSTIPGSGTFFGSAVGFILCARGLYVSVPPTDLRESI